MQGFNMGRYVPPDLEGTTSHNTASGKGHALGSRARKLKTEGVLVVRFECPFAIWCTHCQPEQIIGQGVRFNAEKKKVGQYYSTAVWSFRFKHTACGKAIEVRTDPKNAEYVVVEGGRRRDLGEDRLAEGEVRIGGGAATEEEKERLERDGGFGVLEKKLDDRREADTQKKRIELLAGRSDRDWADPYEMSRRLRKEFRVGRRQRQADEKSGDALKDRFGLEVELVAPSQQDAERAAFIDFGEVKVGDTASKPMFTRTRIVSSTVTSDDQGEYEKSKKGPADQVSTSKDTLQNTLKDNTRNAVDPFLSQEASFQKKWRPGVKRQRVGGNEGGDTTQKDEEKPTLSMSKGKALVGYDSDSS